MPMDVFVVSHSAIEYWQKYRANMLAQGSLPPAQGSGKPVSRRFRSARIGGLGNGVVRDTDVAAALNGPLAGLTAPLHVGVSRACYRRPSKIKECKVCGASVPPSAFVRVGDGVYVAAPEYAFAQLASEISRVDAIRLGFGLCGTYVPSADPTVAARWQVPQLTTTALLSSFVDGLAGQALRGRLAKVLEQVVDNSASPAETNLAMLCCLPMADGGYGLPRPELNRAISVSTRHNGVTGQQTFMCDLLWPDARLGLEYDGEAYHTGIERISHDAARRNGLDYLDFTVLSATKKLVYDSGQLRKLMLQVARHLGVRIRFDNRGYDWGVRHLDLRMRLLFDGAWPDAVRL